MMVELCQRCPDNQITALANAKTEIDIVERDPQIAIETANLMEHCPAHRKTRRGYRREVLLQQSAAKISRIVALTAEVDVPSNTAEAQNHACVLHTPTGINKLRPDCANLKATSVDDQMSQPIRGDDFSIIIEEKEHIASRPFRRPIVD